MNTFHVLIALNFLICIVFCANTTPCYGTSCSHQFGKSLDFACSVSCQCDSNGRSTTLYFFLPKFIHEQLCVKGDYQNCKCEDFKSILDPEFYHEKVEEVKETCILACEDAKSKDKLFSSITAPKLKPIHTVILKRLFGNLAKVQNIHEEDDLEEIMTIVEMFD